MWRRAHTAAELAAAVAAARAEGGLTQAELAEWMGVDRTTVVRLESGGLTQLSRLVDALAVCGYDLTVAPRASDVQVTTTEGVPTT